MNKKEVDKLNKIYKTIENIYNKKQNGVIILISQENDENNVELIKYNISNYEINDILRLMF